MRVLPLGLVVLLRLAAVPRAAVVPSTHVDFGPGFAAVTTTPIDAGTPPAVTAPLTATRQQNADGSTAVSVDGGTFDVVHFGPDYKQLFAAVAGLHGYALATVGAIHLFVEATATAGPLSYMAPFPGALGNNPFSAGSAVGVAGDFTDVLVPPFTTKATKTGDPTTLTLSVFLHCARSDPWDGRTFVGGARVYTSAFVGADLSRPDGTQDFGAVFTQSYEPGFGDSGGSIGAERAIVVPVNTQIVLEANASTEAGALAGYLNEQRPGGVQISDALNTATFVITNEDGVGLTGANGHDYGTASGPTITITTTTTTTTTFVPPTTLPSCAGFCGDGVVQPECGEQCECPMAGPGLAGTVCDGASVVPPLEACARCAGCQVDRSGCPTTTTTTSTTLPATTLPAQPPCVRLGGLARAHCDVEQALTQPLCGADPIPPKVNHGLHGKLIAAGALLGQAEGAHGKTLTRLLKKIRHDLHATVQLAMQAARSKSPKRHVSSACATSLQRFVGEEDHRLASP